jgi:transcriptional regulator with XRE-family HTH domain
VGLDDRPRVAAPDDDAVALRRRIATTVRDHRARAGRSLADLAAAAGIGKSTLHAIESGEANPGIETLWSLARALGVPFGQLLDPPSPAVRVVRAGEGPRVASEASAMHAFLLVTTPPGARAEVYDLHLEPGPVRDAEPHSPGTTEHVLVTAGSLRVGPLGELVDLGVGDLVSFPGEVAHRYQALTEGTRVVLIIEYA